MKKYEQIKKYDMFLDNTITIYDFKNGVLTPIKIEYIKTLNCYNGAITINLYQDEDKNNYLLIYKYIEDNIDLFKEIKD